MADRRTFFSFYYKLDVWRAANVRKAGQFDARAAAGWSDASLWEATKRREDDAVRQAIENGLRGTPGPPARSTIVPFVRLDSGSGDRPRVPL